MRKLISILFLVGLIGGCATNQEKQTWVPKQKNNQVVWADDATDVAVIELQYDEKGSERNNFKHQLYVQNMDGSERRAVTEVREHQNGNLYYMKQAGYFIMESLMPTGARRFDRIDEKGHEILVIETPDSEHQPCADIPRVDNKPLPQVYHTVIPSPDGALLAHVFSLDCGEVSVEFLYSNNLNIITDPIVIPIDEPVNATWHVDNYIILTNNQNTRAWAIRVGQPPEEIAPPNCVAPVTTSSHITYDGRMVYLDETGEVKMRQVDASVAFGCQ
ncbi:hypothetical protein [Candidatus Albibeggiatoa sp. nov. NOAA]|uniref:hypothetical protein n=1 Tax=Candidatus Albibeggiatoa sp. nov. NOAA TaxID=3162724 RepID=UPI0032FF04B9|nr:hypothetical protein [Thiotrichaceae bacterium]